MYVQKLSTEMELEKHVDQHLRAFARLVRCEEEVFNLNRLMLRLLSPIIQSPLTHYSSLFIV